MLCRDGVLTLRQCVFGKDEEEYKGEAVERRRKEEKIGDKKMKEKEQENKS